MTKPFKCYNDSGHGWVAVKRQLLSELNILDKITQFSYQKGQTVYLEEDQDATTFIGAYVAKYGEKPTYISKYTNKSSPIRSYDHFNANYYKS